MFWKKVNLGFRSDVNVNFTEICIEMRNKIPRISGSITLSIETRADIGRLSVNCEFSQH